MRPLILKGHTRPITCVKYNLEGDLVFTASKDPTISCWFTSDGLRLGTFRHKGTVWSIDIDPTTTFLLSASADMTVGIWKVENGQQVQSLGFSSAARVVEFNEGCTQFLVITNRFKDIPCQLHLFNIAISKDKFTLTEEKKVFSLDQEITCATWAALNEYIVLGDERGNIHLLNPANGDIFRTLSEHKERINSFSWDKHKTMLISGGADNKAVLFSVADEKDWKVLKSYASNTPVNAALISPIKEHVLVAGGQEAMNVTTTSARVGKFETKFFHMVFGDEWGSVKGHFGPVNALAMHPEGIGFTSGSEDGYLRVHLFDKDYFKLHSEYDDLEVLEDLAKQQEV